MAEKKPFERLPKTVKPSHYELFLHPDLKTLTFDGKETVKIEILSAVDKIVLHAADLSIKDAVLTLANGETVTSEVSLTPEDELATFSFPKMLPPGPASLSCSFVGELNDKMKGFYRSKYISSATKEETYAAVTQFEATDARRCFPCWDEPAVKAIFSITLCVQPNRVALSNMPVVEESTDANGNKVLKFAPTPVMSTYLVAVVVGEFDYIEDKSDDGVLVRVYTPVGKSDQGKLALHIATKVLPFYKEYFKIAYPLPKLDLIAVADFSAGAMENWGLITFRESCVLVDEVNSSTSTRQWVAIVVGHEIAHQWFGNLVTMEWWTDLWLNEGYASFTENFCVDHLFPEMDIWTQFVTSEHIKALELDAMKNSHPIEVPIGHPSEIDEIFDNISYYKGASVIRMLHRYIGDDDFRKGMNLYLTRHSYSNTFTEDLWLALEEASSKPVKDLMSTWTKQMGFPLINIESCKQVNNSREIVLSQSKFCADGSIDDQNSLWLVPLSFSKSSAPTEECFKAVLKGPKATFTIPNIEANEWIKLNPGTYGFYRTKYPRELLQQFVPSIESKTLPPLDRIGLLDDLFALVTSGKASTVTLMELILAMINEDNYVVWSTISNCLGKISVLISSTEFELQYHKFGRTLLSKIYEKTGWTKKANESHLDTLLRPLVIGTLGLYGDERVIAEAKKKFEEHISGKATIPADLRSAVYKAVLSTGDETTFETLLKLYRKEELHEEKERISNSLGATRKPELLSRALEFAISDEVRAQNAAFIVISVGLRAKGRELAWEFIKNNWKTFQNMYENGPLLIRLVNRSTENFASEEKAQDVESFFKENPWPGFERTIQQSVESIRLNAAWLKRDRDSIQEYLSKL
nr:PREDICTED: puromycin-sensitive aminopeptidase-like [Bemisia tabaci]